jgi:N-acetyl-anhydromuramyl-L-alanine amidase AmpD
MRPASLICLHDTAGNLKPFSSVEWFESPDCTTSAHVVVERDGTITQMVPFDMIAYHAGKSTWNGKPSVNMFGIGIEIVNPGMMERRGKDAVLVYNKGTGEEKIVSRFPIDDCVEVDTPEHGHGWCLPYTAEQIAAVTGVCAALVKAYPTITELVTHWLIAPGRKVDTCPLFPLEHVRDVVFGKGVEEPAPAVIASAGNAAASPPKAGMFDALSFRKVNELADDGSRIASKLVQFKRWIWGTAIGGGTAVASIDTDKGTAGAIKPLIAEHPLLFAVGLMVLGGFILWLCLKVIEKYLCTAAQDGRYTPRGGPQ